MRGEQMAKVTYTGTGSVASTDFKAVKWIGKTKGGKAVTITLDKAINVGNIDWTFAEKNDTVPSIVMSGVYSNTDNMATDLTEPWKIELEDGIAAGASEILLGVGVFYIENNPIALTRGGGSFNVTREFREINADGDRGAVEGRVVMEGSRPTLTMNVLTMLTSLDSLYAGISKA